MRKSRPKGRRVQSGLVLFLGLSVFVASAVPCLATEELADLPEGEAATSVVIPPGSGVIEDFLSCELPDGSAHLEALTPEDMPWRVSVGMPKTSPRMGSRKDGREAAIESMRAWERALQTQLPWFALEFVMKDRDAPVQITWKRRTAGSAQARAGPTCKVEGDRILPGGRMEFAVRACPTCSVLELDEVGLIIAHEFGHILGLGHCLECDSAMNYSFETEKRIAVTQVDVDAVIRRLEMAREFAAAGEGSPDPSAYVDLAVDTTPVLYNELTCKSPFVLKRSCSNDKGPTQRATLGGLDMLLGASKDGSILLMTPDSLASLIGEGAATFAANDRYGALIESAQEKGIMALRARALIYGRHIVGYLIEFDGNAWSALAL